MLRKQSAEYISKMMSKVYSLQKTFIIYKLTSAVLILCRSSWSTVNPNELFTLLILVYKYRA